MEKDNKRKRGILPVTKGAGICSAIFLIAEIAFIAFMLITDIFPTKYFIFFAFLMLIATVIILPLLCSQREKTVKRKIGAVLAVIASVVLAIGSFYLYSTHDMLNNISDKDDQSEDFHVVALKEGSYDEADDIKGEEVSVASVDTDTYAAAKNQLQEQFDVTYKSCGTYPDLGHEIVDDNGNTHDKIIFLNDDSYRTLCEEITGFEDKTKILYTVNIKLESVDIAKNVAVTDETFNVYISGIDTYGNISRVSRSDVNMIMTVNPKTKKILLTSIPRDMYVPLHSYGAKDKLTHSGNFGIDETVTTVEDLLGIDINYYVRVNFTTLQDVVDAIGGVDVNSPQSFTTVDGKYSFNAGLNHVDGKAALAFARERYAFNSGDNERIRNQQRVVQAIINKIVSDKSVLLKYPQLIGTVKDQIQTNMTDSELSALVKMQIGTMASWEIDTISLTGTGSMSTTFSMGSQLVYVMIPSETSVTAAKNAIAAMA